MNNALSLEMIPISSLNALEYCPRSFYYQVPFTPQLRARTRAAIAQAFQVAARETPPPPLSGELVGRCPPCSLLPLCLPEEVRQLRSQKEQ